MDIAQLPFDQGLVVQRVAVLDLLCQQLLETVENDQYVSARGFRWFIIKSPTLLEPTITFGETY